MHTEDPKLECPFCHHADKQVKAGLRDGVQRYRCQHCNRRYSPQPKHRGISAEMRHQALEMRAAGLSATEIGRRLGVNPRSILNWIHAAEGRTSEARPRANKLDGDAAAGTPESDQNSTARRPARRSTIHDVAALAGVSPSTISNHLNGKGRMTESTRERIRAAMSELHFTPNSLIRAIRERKTSILGVVTFGLNDLGDYRRQPIVVDVLGGINRVARARGYNVLLYTALPDDESASAGAIFLDGKIDGLIWVGPSSREQRHLYAARAGLPVMALLSRQESVAYVDIDSIDAIRRVVAHLVEQGHRRIAYAGAIGDQTFLDRLEGYRQGLSVAGIPWDRKLVAANEATSRCWIPTGATGEYEASIDRWLAMPDRPTAIVLTTDEWGAWVIDYLSKRGIRVPEDIAVTGFDDTAQVADPSTILTSVAQDFPEIGRLGTLGLLDLIDGAPYDECQTLLAGKLIIRRSSNKNSGEPLLISTIPSIDPVPPRRT